MKKNYISYILIGVTVAFGCMYRKFREFNTDQTGITDEDLIIDDNGYGIRLGLFSRYLL